MSTPAEVVEQTHVVRKRRFTLEQPRDILKIFEVLRLERAQGRMTFEFRCGGVPTTVEFEQREPLDT